MIMITMTMMMNKAGGPETDLARLALGETGLKALDTLVIQIFRIILIGTKMMIKSQALCVVGTDHQMSNAPQ